MGMDSAPASAYVISWDNLKSIVPQACQAFEDVWHGLTLDEIAQEWTRDCEAFEDDDDKNKALQAAWDSLCEVFTATTRVDDSELSLELGYYDSELGGQYDDLEDGAFLVLWGCISLTPAAERIKDKIEEARWTVYG